MQDKQLQNNLLVGFSQYNSRRRENCVNPIGEQFQRQGMPVKGSPAATKVNRSSGLRRNLTRNACAFQLKGWSVSWLAAERVRMSCLWQNHCCPTLHQNLKDAHLTSHNTRQPENCQSRNTFGFKNIGNYQISISCAIILASKS